MTDFFRLSFLLTVAVLSGWPNGLLHGQSTKVYSDAFGVQGRITFTGELRDSVLPEKGPYLLEWRRTEGDTLYTYRISGTLKNNLPHGTWTREEGDWRYALVPGKDIRPALETEGVHGVWKGRFEAGRAEGLWRYAAGAPLVNPERNDSPLRIEARMRKGVIAGDFKVTDRRDPEAPVILEGRCDENGVAAGTWTLRYREDGAKVTERITFDAGIAAERTFERGGISESDGRTKELKVLLNAARDSAAAVRIGSENFGPETLTGKAGAFTNRYLYALFGAPHGPAEFPLDIALKPPVFKRFEFPLSEEEVVLRAKTEEAAEAVLSVLEALFEERNLEIERARSPELDLAVAFLQAVRSRMRKVEDLMSASRDPLFTYIDRNHGGAAENLRALNRGAEVRGKFYEEDVRRLDTVAAASSDTRYFRAVYDLTKAAEPGITRCLGTIDGIFADFKKEGELKALEARITDSAALLDSLYADASGMAALIAERFIAGQITDDLRAYANTDGYTEALEAGSKLLRDMDTLRSLYPDWEKIDRAAQNLEEGYRYYAYNPYTGERDIELKVKVRFLRKVKTVLLPYLKTQVRESGDLYELVESTDRFLRTESELLRFAFLDERSDKRVERRLRKEDQPARMYRIFTAHMKDR